MSKRRKPPVIKLEDYKQKLVDQAQVVEAGGREFRIPPMALMSHDAYKRIRESDDADIETQARAVMGDAEFVAFVEVGGTEFIVMDLFGKQSENEDAGEDGASSTS